MKCVTKSRELSQNTNTLGLVTGGATVCSDKSNHGINVDNFTVGLMGVRLSVDRKMVGLMVLKSISGFKNMELWRQD